MPFVSVTDGKRTSSAESVTRVSGQTEKSGSLVNTKMKKSSTTNPSRTTEMLKSSSVFLPRSLAVMGSQSTAQCTPKHEGKTGYKNVSSSLKPFAKGTTPESTAVRTLSQPDKQSDRKQYVSSCAAQWAPNHRQARYGYVSSSVQSARDTAASAEVRTMYRPDEMQSDSLCATQYVPKREGMVYYEHLYGSVKPSAKGTAASAEVRTMSVPDKMQSASLCATQYVPKREGMVYYEHLFGSVKPSAKGTAASAEVRTMSLSDKMQSVSSSATQCAPKHGHVRFEYVSSSLRSARGTTAASAEVRNVCLPDEMQSVSSYDSACAPKHVGTVPSKHESSSVQPSAKGATPARVELELRAVSLPDEEQSVSSRKNTSISSKTVRAGDCHSSGSPSETDIRQRFTDAKTRVWSVSEKRRDQTKATSSNKGQVLKDQDTAQVKERSLELVEEMNTKSSKALAELTMPSKKSSKLSTESVTQTRTPKPCKPSIELSAQTKTTLSSLTESSAQMISASASKSCSSGQVATSKAPKSSSDSSAQMISSKASRFSTDSSAQMMTSKTSKSSTDSGAQMMSKTSKSSTESGAQIITSKTSRFSTDSSTQTISSKTSRFSTDSSAHSSKAPKSSTDSSAQMTSSKTSRFSTDSSAQMITSKTSKSSTDSGAQLMSKTSKSSTESGAQIITSKTSRFSTDSNAQTITSKAPKSSTGSSAQMISSKAPKSSTDSSAKTISSKTSRFSTDSSAQLISSKTSRFSTDSSAQKNSSKTCRFSTESGAPIITSKTSRSPSEPSSQTNSRKSTISSAIEPSAQISSAKTQPVTESRAQTSTTKSSKSCTESCAQVSTSKSSKSASISTGPTRTVKSSQSLAVPTAQTNSTMSHKSSTVSQKSSTKSSQSSIELGGQLTAPKSAKPTTVLSVETDCIKSVRSSSGPAIVMDTVKFAKSSTTVTENATKFSDSFTAVSTKSSTVRSSKTSSVTSFTKAVDEKGVSSELLAASYVRTISDELAKPLTGQISSSKSHESLAVSASKTDKSNVLAISTAQSVRSLKQSGLSAPQPKTTVTNESSVIVYSSADKSQATGSLSVAQKNKQAKSVLNRLTVSKSLTVPTFKTTMTMPVNPACETRGEALSDCSAAQLSDGAQINDTSSKTKNNSAVVTASSSKVIGHSGSTTVSTGNQSLISDSPVIASSVGKNDNQPPPAISQQAVVMNRVAEAKKKTKASSVSTPTVSTTKTLSLEEKADYKRKMVPMMVPMKRPRELSPANDSKEQKNDMWCSVKKSRVGEETVSSATSANAANGMSERDRKGVSKKYSPTEEKDPSNTPRDKTVSDRSVQTQDKTTSFKPVKVSHRLTQAQEASVNSLSKDFTDRHIQTEEMAITKVSHRQVQTDERRIGRVLCDRNIQTNERRSSRRQVKCSQTQTPERREGKTSAQTAANSNTSARSSDHIPDHIEQGNWEFSLHVSPLSIADMGSEKWLSLLSTAEYYTVNLSGQRQPASNKKQTGECCLYFERLLHVKSAMVRLPQMPLSSKTMHIEITKQLSTSAAEESVVAKVDIDLTATGSLATLDASTIPLSKDCAGDKSVYISNIPEYVKREMLFVIFPSAYTIQEPVCGASVLQFRSKQVASDVLKCYTRVSINSIQLLLTGSDTPKSQEAATGFNKRAEEECFASKEEKTRVANVLTQVAKSLTDIVANSEEVDPTHVKIFSEVAQSSFKAARALTCVKKPADMSNTSTKTSAAEERPAKDSSATKRDTKKWSSTDKESSMKTKKSNSETDVRSAGTKAAKDLNDKKMKDIPEKVKERLAKGSSTTKSDTKRSETDQVSDKSVKKIKRLVEVDVRPSSTKAAKDVGEKKTKDTPKNDRRPAEDTTSSMIKVVKNLEENERTLKHRSKNSATVMDVANMSREITSDVPDTVRKSEAKVKKKGGESQSRAVAEASSRAEAEQASKLPMGNCDSGDSSILPVTVSTQTFALSKSERTSPALDTTATKDGSSSEISHSKKWKRTHPLLQTADSVGSNRDSAATTVKSGAKRARQYSEASEDVSHTVSVTEQLAPKKFRQDQSTEQEGGTDAAASISAVNDRTHPWTLLDIGVVPASDFVPAVHSASPAVKDMLDMVSEQAKDCQVLKPQGLECGIEQQETDLLSSQSDSKHDLADAHAVSKQICNDGIEEQSVDHISPQNGNQQLLSSEVSSTQSSDRERDLQNNACFGKVDSEQSVWLKEATEPQEAKITHSISPQQSKKHGHGVASVCIEKEGKNLTTICESSVKERSNLQNNQTMTTQYASEDVSTQENNAVCQKMGRKNIVKVPHPKTANWQHEYKSAKLDGDQSEGSVGVMNNQEVGKRDGQVPQTCFIQHKHSEDTDQPAVPHLSSLVPKSSSVFVVQAAANVLPLSTGKVSIREDDKDENSPTRNADSALTTPVRQVVASSSQDSNIDSEVMTPVHQVVARHSQDSDAGNAVMTPVRQVVASSSQNSNINSAVMTSVCKVVVRRLKDSDIGSVRMTPVRQVAASSSQDSNIDNAGKTQIRQVVARHSQDCDIGSEVMTPANQVVASSSQDSNIDSEVQTPIHQVVTCSLQHSDSAVKIPVHQVITHGSQDIDMEPETLSDISPGKKPFFGMKHCLVSQQMSITFVNQTQEKGCGKDLNRSVIVKGEEQDWTSESDVDSSSEEMELGVADLREHLLTKAKYRNAIHKAVSQKNVSESHTSRKTKFSKRKLRLESSKAKLIGEETCIFPPESPKTKCVESGSFSQSHKVKKHKGKSGCSGQKLKSRGNEHATYEQKPKNQKKLKSTTKRASTPCGTHQRYHEEQEGLTESSSSRSPSPCRHFQSHVENDDQANFTFKKGRKFRLYRLCQKPAEHVSSHRHRKNIDQTYPESPEKVVEKEVKVFGNVGKKDKKAHKKLSAEETEKSSHSSKGKISKRHKKKKKLRNKSGSRKDTKSLQTNIQDPPRSQENRGSKEKKETNTSKHHENYSLLHGKSQKSLSGVKKSRSSACRRQRSPESQEKSDDSSTEESSSSGRKSAKIKSHYKKYQSESSPRKVKRHKMESSSERSVSGERESMKKSSTTKHHKRQANKKETKRLVRESSSETDERLEKKSSSETTQKWERDPRSRTTHRYEKESSAEETSPYARKSATEAYYKQKRQSSPGSNSRQDVEDRIYRKRCRSRLQKGTAERGSIQLQSESSSVIQRQEQGSEKQSNSSEVPPYKMASVTSRQDRTFQNFLEPDHNRDTVSQPVGQNDQVRTTQKQILKVYPLEHEHSEAAETGVQANEEAMETSNNDWSSQTPPFSQTSKSIQDYSVADLTYFPCSNTYIPDPSTRDNADFFDLMWPSEPSGDVYRGFSNLICLSAPCPEDSSTALPSQTYTPDAYEDLFCQDCSSSENASVRESNLIYVSGSSTHSGVPAALTIDIDVPTPNLTYPSYYDDPASLPNWDTLSSGLPKYSSSVDCIPSYNPEISSSLTSLSSISSTDFPMDTSVLPAVSSDVVYPTTENIMYTVSNIPAPTVNHSGLSSDSSTTVSCGASPSSSEVSLTAPTRSCSAAPTMQVPGLDLLLAATANIVSDSDPVPAARQPQKVLCGVSQEDQDLSSFFQEKSRADWAQAEGIRSPFSMDTLGQKQEEEALIFKDHFTTWREATEPKPYHRASGIRYPRAVLNQHQVYPKVGHAARGQNQVHQHLADTLSSGQTSESMGSTGAQIIGNLAEAEDNSNRAQVEPYGTKDPGQRPQTVQDKNRLLEARRIALELQALRDCLPPLMSGIVKPGSSLGAASGAQNRPLSTQPVRRPFIIHINPNLLANRRFAEELLSVYCQLDHIHTN